MTFSLEYQKKGIPKTTFFLLYPYKTLSKIQIYHPNNNFIETLYSKKVQFKLRVKILTPLTTTIYLLMLEVLNQFYFSTKYTTVNMNTFILGFSVSFYITNGHLDSLHYFICDRFIFFSNKIKYKASFLHGLTHKTKKCTLVTSICFRDMFITVTIVTFITTGTQYCLSCSVIYVRGFRYFHRLQKRYTAFSQDYRGWTFLCIYCCVSQKGYLNGVNYEPASYSFINSKT